MTYKDFGAGEDSLLNHVEVVAIITLTDDIFARFLAHTVHCIENNIQLIGVQGVEHKGLIKAVLQRFLDFICLGVHWRLEIFLFVPIAECLCGHRLTGTLFHGSNWLALDKIGNFIIFLRANWV